MRSSKLGVLAVAVACSTMAFTWMISMQLWSRRPVLLERNEETYDSPEAIFSHLSRGTSQPELSRKIAAVDRYIAEVENYRDHISTDSRNVHKVMFDPPPGQHGVDWNHLDCRLHGPVWESRALGCPRPGGCGLQPSAKMSNYIPACGIHSAVCVGAFKACLSAAATKGLRSVDEACQCYRELAPADTCGDSCASSILHDFALMAKQCYGIGPRAGNFPPSN